MFLTTHLGLSDRILGRKTEFVTHNWCDKRTWYQKATRVVDEVASCANAPTYTQYDVTSGRVLIDTFHARLSGEDFLFDDNGNSFRVVVKVNDVEKAEQDPNIGSGGDYTIDYLNGRVTFLSALTASDEVKVTYHYAGSSEFCIQPTAGKHIRVTDVEVQFSTNIDLTDTMRFQAYVGGNPYGQPDVYKCMQDYINQANGSLPTIPQMGGASHRGMSGDQFIFTWRYNTPTDLPSQANIDVRLKLDNDQPYGGDIAVATFYCLSTDE